jgi:hypothetical protein
VHISDVNVQTWSVKRSKAVVLICCAVLLCLAYVYMQDFYNLINVYLDAVLFPRAVKDPLVMQQEVSHIRSCYIAHILTYLYMLLYAAIVHCCHNNRAYNISISL